MKNIKHFLATSLVAVVCLFGTSSCLTSLIVEAARETKRQLKEENEGPKVIPGDYDFSAVAPSGQRLYYKYNGSGSVRVVSPQRNYISGNVVVPEKVKKDDKELSVVRIFDDAFAFCSDLTSIVLPKSISKIDYKNAFSGCPNLRTIVFYSSPSYHQDSDGLKNYLYSEEVKGESKRVLMVPKESLGYFRGAEVFRQMGDIVTTIPITEDYSFFESGNIDEYMTKNKSWLEAVAEWGPCDDTYSFISISSNGQALCYTISEDGQTVGFTNPQPRNGNYVNGNVIIPDTVEYNGKKYPVAEIKKYGLQCKGASSYFIPSTVSYIGDNVYYVFGEGVARDPVPFVVCYATNPPQRPKPGVGYNGENKYSTLNCVVQVPKGCLDKYKTAETWNQQPEFIMEVGDDFQQYLDEVRIDEYMEKAKNSINFKQMSDAQLALDAKKQNEKKALQEQREKEWRAAQEAEAKRIRKELISQYGTKYVDALYNNGKLIVGMPIGLVRFGLKNSLFKKPYLYYMNLEHQSANSESYELRGSYDGFSGSIYLGMVFFSNGKVSSIRWANY